ncbi:unnamed protein product [Arctia plantaginis]|uniref:Uncharacterized protein n=1 Tax=Arctia plantaginis TaxID=874455 RepID=A0A8S1AUJ6_ARCPL|nr:unnamed protein product [Arctia plantaginis]
MKNPVIFGLAFLAVYVRGASVESQSDVTLVVTHTDVTYTLTENCEEAMAQSAGDEAPPEFVELFESLKEIGYESRENETLSNSTKVIESVDAVLPEFEIMQNVSPRAINKLDSETD